jgi:hypothetical protein
VLHHPWAVKSDICSAFRVGAVIVGGNDARTAAARGRDGLYAVLEIDVLRTAY